MLQFIKFPQNKVEERKKMKKGDRRGPFYFFMLEKKEEWISEGLWDPGYSMTDLATACKPSWDLLRTNPDLVEPYQRKASEYRKEKTEEMEKLDCLGRPLKILQLEAERIEKKWMDMEAEIRSTVKDPQLLKKSFYVAHFNYQCEARGEFPPCEASIVKFSLEEGIEDTWQEFVSPLDSVPLGYKFKCIQRARETHCLGPDFTQYREDMKDILDEILGFLQAGEGAGNLPPLYVGKDDMEAAENIANFITERAGSEVELRIFPLFKLLQEFIMHSNSVLVENLMERDIYSHHPGLACALHEGLARGYFCSLSICKRQVFTLLNVASRCRRIQMRSGKHFPAPSMEEERLVDVDIAGLRLEHDDRINRMIPNPAGISKIIEEEERGDQEPRRSVVESWLVSSQKSQVEMGAMGGIGGTFPSTDIREKFKVQKSRPKLFKLAKKDKPEDVNNNVGQ